MKNSFAKATFLKLGLAAGLFAAVLVAPRPAALPEEGARVLAVMTLAVVLWVTEALPPGLTGLLAMLLLALTRAVHPLPQAFSGLASPVPYFLLAVLAMGHAVLRSGLAERGARLFLSWARGSPLALFGQMVLSFVPLTFLMPSALTRTGVLIHVYDQALSLGQVPPGAPLAKAVMLALTSLNRLASTALLTGGITPMAAAAIIGGFSWAGWLIMMAIPYYALLLVGAALLYLAHRRGFPVRLTPAIAGDGPIHGRATAPMWRCGATVGVVSLLWLTDPLHHLAPAIPALLGLAVFLTPRLGVLSWRDMGRGAGWSSFVVLAASLSLAQAVTTSGAAEWLGKALITPAANLAPSPMALLLALLVAATVVRLLIPSIGGFLALALPVTIATATQSGLDPVVAALAVVMVGDAVLYYPAQSPSSLVVYQQGHLTTGEIGRFAVLMTVVSYAVVFLVALPYWAAIGHPVAR